MGSLGSLACGLQCRRGGAPAWFTCLNKPRHEGQGNFLGRELGHKAVAPISGTLNSASQDSGWEKPLTEVCAEKGRARNIKDAIYCRDCCRFCLQSFFCITQWKSIPPFDNTSNGAYICWLGIREETKRDRKSCRGLKRIQGSPVHSGDAT